ncbi:hypothetical protein ILUMI_25902 [Ignelater luminosus]|uniref:Uncharacterized protein n=1 Tax=Ignelater luminosus TaxID=2038154 RepID=A0A8K0C6M7_IGNLU|nr:hypothetical protein ILUMI_25902 [Ignelater luminosus]
MSSGFSLNVDKFKSFCLETSRLYVKLHSWYPVSTSLHKIPIHGSEILSEAILPIGQFSEEAQETRISHFPDAPKKHAGYKEDAMVKAATLCEDFETILHQIEGDQTLPTVTHVVEKNPDTNQELAASFYHLVELRGIEKKNSLLKRAASLNF